MMQYIEKNHPNSKMLGSASSFKLLKSFTLSNLILTSSTAILYVDGVKLRPTA
jgi:hypothetical protein